VLAGHPDLASTRAAAAQPTIPLLISDKGSRASAGAFAHARAITIVRHGAKRTGPARSPRRRCSREPCRGSGTKAIVGGGAVSARGLCRRRGRCSPPNRQARTVLQDPAESGRLDERARWRRTGSLASAGETFADALRIEAASSVASSRGHHGHAEL
jgi:hypothetical protein